MLDRHDHHIGGVRGPKKLVVLEGGTHLDLYDVPKHVDRTVAESVPFFRENLAVTAVK
ncbi:hypothetical protein F9C11_30280 [Amycolatopsis sp. VS8301801F10]|uniref:hypothetical protein n=1 Tax=Amycolatopsis sp. VS8301801F10 TaxID=2652442 RepID=UPI0038FC54E9